MSSNVSDFEFGFLIAATIINPIFSVIICLGYWLTSFNAGWSGSEDAIPCGSICCYCSPLLLLANIAIVIVLWIVTVPSALFWCLIIIPMVISVLGVFWTCYISNQSYD